MPRRIVARGGDRVAELFEVWVMKLFSALACAALCSAALAACGGGETSSHSSAIPNTTTSSGSARSVRSTCTPDSYGYCLAPRKQTSVRIQCDGVYAMMITKWNELYYYTTDEGSYTESINQCTGDDTWSPEDPSQATGDPNLP
jgi:hypothetical protein